VPIDDPFRSAPLRIPEAPKAPPRPWLTPQRLQLLRHAVMIEGTAVMFAALLFPIRPMRLDRFVYIEDDSLRPFVMCSSRDSLPLPRDAVSGVDLGVSTAVLVVFIGFLLGRSPWMLRATPHLPDDTRWARIGAFFALTYAGLGFLVTGFWAPYSLERPVLTPIFLALCVVTLLTRVE
jgi:hypothetical protein